MIVSTLILTTFFVIIAITAVAAYSDFRRLQIDNSISIIISMAFLIALILDIVFLKDFNIFGSWWSGISAAAITFIVTFAMFSFGILGGGDSKLASALSLWIGIKGLIAFLFYMSIAGGVLALIAIICRKKEFLKNISAKLGEGSWLYALYNGKNALPYGIAIFAGSMGAFFYSGLFQKMYLLSSGIFIVP